MTDAIQKHFNTECDVEGNEFSVKKAINGIAIAVKCTIGKVGYNSVVCCPQGFALLMCAYVQNARVFQT